MAAPIAHIFCALSLLATNAIEVNNPTDFIIGTSFPDIRYLGVIERNQTHAKNVTWNDVITASNSFEQGRLLHCLVDEVRETFVEQNNLYQFIPTSLFRTHILKFYEDIILYKTIKNWPHMCDCFDNVLPEEVAYNINAVDIQAWHTILKNYCSRQPNANNIVDFLQQRLAVTAQKESNPFKRFLIQCKGIIINKIAYFKLRSILNDLKKQNELTAAIKFFYTNIHTFLIKRTKV